MRSTDPGCVLLAVDDSAASARATLHVARELAPAGLTRVRLVHVLPVMPPALLELRGLEDPDELESEEARYAARREAWRREQEAQARPMLERHRARLTAEGVPARALETACLVPLPEESVARLLRRDALAHGCGRVVLGRQDKGWYRELFERHTADDLAREDRSDELDLVVVE